MNYRLEFRARLSTAMRYLGPGKEVPTRDLFEFSGRLTRTSITGKLRQADGLESANPPAARRVHLRRLVGDGGRNPAGSIVGESEWQAWAAELMRRRGPSW